MNNQPTDLSFLLLEDNALDAELIIAKLNDGGFVFDWRRVETRDDFAAALTSNCFSLILADYSLPSFDGMSAMKIAQELCPDVPFLFVSGALGEEVAIESLKSGAIDYVLKQRLDRLAPSVGRALREAAERAERVRAQRALREANDELEKRVAARTADLMTANIFLKEQVKERERAERRLRENEKLLIEAQHIAHLGSWQWNPKTNEFECSDELCRIFCLDPHGFAGTFQAFLNLIYQDDRASVMQSLSQALQERQPVTCEHRIVRPDGSLRTLYCRAEVLTEDSGEPVKVVGTEQDVTENKQMEEHLRQTQKMESVGLLAGGIAHDFNNLLTAVLGHSDLVLGRLQATDPLRPNVEEIKKAGERAASLTRQLLAFSRRQFLQPKVLNLNETVFGMHKMLSRLIGEHIELETKLTEPLWNVKADPNQIEQVLLNLSVNARDSMPEGGHLVITITNVEMNQEIARKYSSVRSGAHVRISVSDTGCGIPPELEERIFEPFFTTKDVGRGTGLGLSTAYGIVKQSNGYIEVKSESGVGTTFNIYLPREEERIATASEHATAEPAPSGHETILLVEDEAMVRQMTREVLETAGYKVLEASNGEEAVRCYQADVDLLLADMVMPKMGGRQLAALLLQKNPHLKVLYMSGYAEGAILGDETWSELDALIEKPFEPGALVRKIRHLLDQDPTPKA